jgi:YNFM family putative membrane transporter
VSPAASSLALSLSTGLLAPAILCAAALSEGLGRRGLMFVSMACAACLNIAAAFAPSWPVLLIIRAMEGIALGGAPAVAMSYLAEEIHPDGLGLAMGLYVGGTAFGGMTGRVATSVLAEFLSWRPALAIVGTVGLLAAFGFILLIPPSSNFRRRAGFDLRYHARAWSRHLGDPGLRLLFAISFLAMGAFVGVYNYAGFRLTTPPFDLNQTELGLIFTVYLFGIGASWQAGALADRIGRHLVLPVSIVTAAAGVGLTLLPGLASMILGIILLTIGFFAGHAVASGWVGRLAAGTKGHASSLYLLAYYMGSSIIGSAGGWFWAEGGWPAVAGFTLTVQAVALLASLRLRSLTE